MWVCERKGRKLIVCVREREGRKLIVCGCVRERVGN